jgi:hydrogenase maturation protein HypF
VFDGIAAILELCPRNSFEAQSPMAMESAAAAAADVDDACDDGPGALFEITDDPADPAMRQIDLAPLTRHIVARFDAGESADRLAMRFHRQLARAWAAAALQAMDEHSIDCIGLTGGVFANQVLAGELTRRLAMRGATVLRHCAVPPGDGGLCLGQAAHVAARRATIGDDKNVDRRITRDSSSPRPAAGGAGANGRSV